MGCQARLALIPFAFKITERSPFILKIDIWCCTILYWDALLKAYTRVFPSSHVIADLCYHNSHQAIVSVVLHFLRIEMNKKQGIER